MIVHFIEITSSLTVIPVVPFSRNNVFSPCRFKQILFRLDNSDILSPSTWSDIISPDKLLPEFNLS